jgi:hypothetical protein
MHVATHAAAFVPALVWLGSELGASVVAIAALISIPHLIQDDGRPLTRYIRVVKHLEARPCTSSRWPWSRCSRTG